MIGADVVDAELGPMIEAFRTTSRSWSLSVKSTQALSPIVCRNAQSQYVLFFVAGLRAGVG